MTAEQASVMIAVAPEGAGEAIMIAEREYETVHSLFAQGWHRKRIARQLGLDVKTVRKWLNQPLVAQQRQRESKVEPWREFLQGRGPEVGWNGSVLFREAQDLGFPGSYVTLARYVGQLRPSHQAAEMATLRYETEPGQQAQVDWGQIGVWLGRGPDQHLVRVHFFTMVLGFSRRIYARAYLNERLDSLLDAHERAFAHFGGRTRGILYDNPRTIVRGKDEATGRIDWNPRFKDRLDFYGVDIRLCHYYRAQTKGKTESGVKYVKRNALPGHAFSDLDPLNEYLLHWCTTVADQRRHGTTGEQPAARFARAEQAALLPVLGRPAAPYEMTLLRRVPRDAYVALETNRYGVWWEWVAREVQVRQGLAEVVILGPGRAPLHYERLRGRHQVAPWQGPPRGRPPLTARSCASSGPPRFDPLALRGWGEVESRSLLEYHQLVEEVAP